MFLSNGTVNNAKHCIENDFKLNLTNFFINTHTTKVVEDGHQLKKDKTLKFVSMTMHLEENMVEAQFIVIQMLLTNKSEKQSSSTYKHSAMQTEIASK